MNDHLKRRQPSNNHLMALINFISLVPLVYFIPDIIGGFLPAIKWLNVVAGVAIIVPIMSYGVRPIAHAALSSREKEVA